MDTRPTGGEPLHLDLRNWGGGRCVSARTFEEVVFRMEARSRRKPFVENRGAARRGLRGPGPKPGPSGRRAGGGSIDATRRPFGPGYSDVSEGSDFRYSTRSRFSCVGQPELEVRVVVLHHVRERREPAVVVEAALRAWSNSPRERRRPVALVRRPLRLEVVDADLVRRVCMFQPGSVNSGGTWQLAQSRLAVEQRLPALGRGGVEAPRRRLRGREGELVELQRRRASA